MIPLEALLQDLLLRTLGNKVDLHPRLPRVSCRWPQSLSRRPQVTQVVILDPVIVWKTWQVHLSPTHPLGIAFKQSRLSHSRLLLSLPLNQNWKTQGHDPFRRFRCNRYFLKVWSCDRLLHPRRSHNGFNVDGRKVTRPRRFYQSRSNKRPCNSNKLRIALLAWICVSWRRGLPRWREGFYRRWRPRNRHLEGKNRHVMMQICFAKI